jgi:hypothetical protein
MFKVFIAALIVANAYAGCDNQCSGHGTCGLDGLCTCYDNWGIGIGHISGDCSDRMCPFDFAWADAPNHGGLQHQYAECSAQGVCNRDSGECECFPGYTGAGCARMTCPNDCSGHGLCKSIQYQPFAEVSADFPNNVVNFASQVPYTFSNAYYDWDKSKTFGCVCDSGYGDNDCSKRMCEFGTDVMDHRINMALALKYQVQTIKFEPAAGVNLPLTGDFSLTFKSKLNESYSTRPITWRPGPTQVIMNDFLLDVRAALESLPNRVIDQVNVAASVVLISSSAASTFYAGSSVSRLLLSISFVGNNVQGPQNLLTVKTSACSDGCTPKLNGLTLSVQNNAITETQAADYQSYECGRRGKCDYSSGTCTCFSGYTGLACNTITALV